MSEMNLRNERNVRHSYSFVNFPVVKEEDYPEITSLTCQKELITATLSDGRLVSIPTVWFKRLRDATLAQLSNFEILPDGYGIHWPDIDEDISVKAFLKGLN